MSFIDKIKIENTDYDIQDTEGRKLIDKCLKTESDPTVPKHVKTITEQNINNWNNKSNFSGKYSDLTGIPSEFKPSTHTHKMSDITDYKEPDMSKYALKSEIPTNYITEIPSEYVTETELNNKGYALKTDIPKDYITEIPAEYVTESELDNKGYALKSEIPTNYITEIPAEYVTETELNEAISSAIGTVLGGEY